MNMSQQSQTDFLSKVAGWTKETCLNNLDTALPALIVAALIDGALEKIQINLSGNLQGSSQDEIGSVIEECLQWTLDIGTCLESCINHTVGCAASSLELSQVHSLPQCALHFLRQVYKHCRDSSALYGGLLDAISQAMSLVFKKAHSVQMLVLRLLDKVYVTGSALEDQVIVLSSLCTGLFEVCSLVTSLDVKLSVSLWKSISRLCSQHLNLLRDRLDVCPFINFLCEEIKGGYCYLFQLSPQADTNTLCDGDDKAFSKTVRILGFQMKVVVALLRDFCDYLGECEHSLLGLLLCLHRFLPPSLSATPLPDKQDAEVRTQVVNATVPCLMHLAGNRAFRSVFTQQLTPDNNPEDNFPMLLLRLMVLDILPKCEDDVVDMWMRPVKKADGSSLPDLLSAIFSSVHQCKVELQLPVMLPGVVVAGEPHRQVSLYEHIVTHICGMIGACPARHFSALESTCLTQVLGGDDLLCVLAIDCWCFMARYGTASVCNTQVHALLAVLRKLIMRGQGLVPASKVKLTSRLAHLASRLLKFMSPEHQLSLVQKYPPESNLALWLRLHPAGLAADLATDVESRLVTSALSVLSPTSGSVKSSQLFLSLQLLEEVIANNNKGCRDSGAQLCPLTPTQQTQVLVAVMALWSDIRTSTPLGHPCLPPGTAEELLTNLLPISCRLLLLMETKDILLILQAVDALTSDRKTSTQVLVRCASFLSGFSRVRLGCSYLDCQALEYLPRVFHSLLGHTHPMVHQHALASFSQFASMTSHEDLVPACLRGEESLVQAVQNYVNHIPHQTFEGEFQLLQYLCSEENRLSVEQQTHQASKGQSSSVEQKAEEAAAEDLESQGRINEEYTDDIGDFSERPAKRRRAISESDEEEEATLPPAKDKANQPMDHNVSDVTTSRDIPNPQQTNTAASSLPPLTGDGGGGQSLDDRLRSVLGRLQHVAKDLEKVCSNNSDHRPPPRWFVDQVKVELARCSDAISCSASTSQPDDTGWLDNLS
ncbi:chromosome 1 open reading frame 112 [Elysia marginata]|uniref:Chromosome 1 open reading frame 112 n=1 Tax=Elysia marginata TaxID=1093978 RepID=A0AAV4EGL4_9GAST|nr:chromosome 1 open reading frame 112 [Elysia marginata]